MAFCRHLERADALAELEAALALEAPIAEGPVAEASTEGEPAAYSEEALIQSLSFWQAPLTVAEGPTAEAQEVEAQRQELLPNSVQEGVQAPSPPVLLEGSEPSLSPSAVDTFMRCPRQFFYQRLLRLPSEPNPAAERGQVLHHVLETYHQQQPNFQEASSPSLLAWAQQLLSTPPSQATEPCPPAEGPRANPEASPLKAYWALPPLVRQQWAETVLEALENLEAQGYFRQPWRYVHSEVAYHQLKLPQLPTVRWTMRLDVLAELGGTGTAEAPKRLAVVDYKHYGQHRFAAARPETNEKHLAACLSPLPTGDPGLEEGLPATTAALQHAERFSNPHRSYQLPLYYLAVLAQAAEEGETVEVEQLGLQLLRAPQVNPKLQKSSSSQQAQASTGSVFVPLSVSALKAALPQLCHDLNTQVLQPILTTSEFMPVPEAGHCESCSYQGLCPKAASQPQGGGGPYG